MSNKPKFTYEGMYAGRTGLVVCVRVETGGVPRFENVLLPYAEMSREDASDLTQAAVVVMATVNAAPWTQDELPGIG